MKKNKKAALLVLPTLGVAGMALATATFFSKIKESNEASEDLTQASLALEKISVGGPAKLSIVNDKDELPDHSDTLTNGRLSFIVPESSEENGNYLDGVTLTYQHGEIKHDGELEVIVTATKGGESARSSFKINVVDLDKSIIDELKNSIVGSSYSTENNFIDSAENAKAVNGEYLGIKLPNELYDAKVTFSHQEITADGSYDVTVNITSGDTTDSKVVSVNVSGITGIVDMKATEFISSIDKSSFTVDSTVYPSFNHKESFIQQIQKLDSYMTLDKNVQSKITEILENNLELTFLDEEGKLNISIENIDGTKNNIDLSGYITRVVSKVTFDQSNAGGYKPDNYIEYISFTQINSDNVLIKTFDTWDDYLVALNSDSSISTMPFIIVEGGAENRIDLTQTENLPISKTIEVYNIDINEVELRYHHYRIFASLLVKVSDWPSKVRYIPGTHPR